jgi:ASC-1-like (ASCH) protein
METSEELTVNVIGLHKFNSFKDLYEHIDKKLIGYSENEEVNPNHMDEFYSKEEQEKYGALAIEIKLI